MKKSAARLAASLLAALLVSCAGKEAPDSQSIEVKTLVAVKSKQSVTLESYGSITYKKKNEARSIVEGTIVEQNALEGKSVQKGETLFRLENIQYQIQRAERQNQLNSARAKLKAAKNNLLEQERSAQSTIIALENARTNLMQKKDERALLLKNLEKNKRLFDAGGISESSLEQMQMEERASKSEIDVLEKELQMKSLGYNESDLINAGMEPSADVETRQRQLIDLNSQSAKIQIELAEVELKNAERDLESIEALIEALTVTAPCDGIIGAIYFENGERVTQNERLATIIDMKIPYAKVFLQERDMEKIQIGAPTLVEIDSAAFRQESIVDFISPLADSETGNFYIKIPVDNSENKIRFGMFAKCAIQTKSTGEYFELPESALRRRDGNTAYFFCVQNDFLYQKECPIEMERDGNIYIKSGLKEGDKIVVRPTNALKEGLRVKCI